MEVDLVYTWCDDSDPKWRAKRVATAERFGIASDPVRNGACRYRGGDMIRYSLRSAFKSVPWVHTIHVVVDDDQTAPDWPEFGDARVRFVRHSEIMPAEILPCFSSVIIEHHLARIPGLAPRFLYANDDTFFWGDVRESFFFAADGYPHFRYGSRRRATNAAEADYHCRLDAADALLRERYGMKPGRHSMIGRLPHHNVDAYVTADYAACRAEFDVEIAAELTFPFRNPKLVQRALYAGYALAVGHGHFRRSTFNTKVGAGWWRRLLPSWADSLQIVPGRWRQGPDLIARFRPKLVCFNDGPATTDADFAWLHDYLADMFDKSAYDSARQPRRQALAGEKGSHEVTKKQVT